MKKIKIIQKPIMLISLLTILFTISCVVYATQLTEKSNRKALILVGYERQKMDISSPTEIEISKDSEKQIPEINSKSKQLLNSFNKDISTTKNVKKIYDKTLNREVTRITSKDTEIDFDSNGNIVSYKNFDDFSTVDKNKKDYNENEILSKIDYKLKKSSDLSDIISTIEKENDLAGYKLVECNNDIESVWTLTWNREHENGLLNSYDCVNVIIDAKDGSIMLFGKNKMEANTTVPILTKDEAIKLANSIISKYDKKNIDIKLTFFKPNFYFEEGGPYETANFVRLSWEVSIKDTVNVQIDAETGEILGGGETQAVSGRAMSVTNFPGQQERATLASNALSRLGYSQSGYPPVYWTVKQTDMNWLLSRTDLYGLYLLSHGGISNGVSVLADSNNLGTANWQIWSNKNYGIWRFVYLDACETSANNNFANAFKATYAGECFIGWNNNVNTYTALDFNRRFFPRLGYTTVHDAVVTSLWESRNAGFNGPDTICNPGFIGDINYYGWAW